MTDKQAVFVQEYLTCLNATEAAKRAGYSLKTAYSIGQRLMKKSEIQNAIQDGMTARTIRTELSQDYVINNLLEIVDRSMQARPVIDSKGNQVQDSEYNNLWTFDAKNAIRALELLGRHLGMFNDKLQVHKSENENIVFAWINENEKLKTGS